MVVRQERRPDERRVQPSALLSPYYSSRIAEASATTPRSRVLPRTSKLARESSSNSSSISRPPFPKETDMVSQSDCDFGALHVLRPFRREAEDRGGVPQAHAVRQQDYPRRWMRRGASGSQSARWISASASRATPAIWRRLGHPLSRPGERDRTFARLRQRESSRVAGHRRQQLVGRDLGDADFREMC
jgi:hypothetical protein